MSRPAYDPDPHAHPGLHVVALVEGAKGLLALLGASGLELVGPVSLLRWVDALIARFQFNPEHGVFAWLQRSINPESLHFAAAAIAAYGLLHLVEAWGLWRARAWASWLGCITASLYLPFEVHALATHPGWLELAVLSINLIVVYVLSRDLVRRRR